jgi:hypothetical protein
MKHTRENINNETLFTFYEKLSDKIQAAAETKRDIEAWQRRRDEAALARVLAKLNAAEGA